MRNRVRRRLRAAAREHAAELVAGPRVPRERGTGAAAQQSYDRALAPLCHDALRALREEMRVKRSRPARGLLRSINLYQQLSAHRPSPCRYIPSCSEYAREAVETHGAGRGAWLAVRRLSPLPPARRARVRPGARPRWLALRTRRRSRGLT